KILNSDVAFVGKISDLFGDMLIKGIVNIPKADLKTVAAILPKDMDIKLLGNASGKVNIDSRLSYLTDMKLEKINASGKINLKNIDFAMPKDTLFAKLDNSTLDFQLNAKNNDKLPNFIRATFVSDNLDAQFAENKIKAVKPNLNIAMGDIRKDISDIYADFAFADIDLQGDSIALLTQNVVGKAQIQPSKRKNVSNRYSLELKANNTDAVAFLNKLNVNSLDIKLKGAVKENENDFLLKYLASGDMKISGLKATLKDIDEKIEIPSIRFNFTPNDYHIQEGKVVLGNSDFALNGDIYNLRKFLKDKDTLIANLTFNSNVIDINELLGIYSKMGLETEESLAQEQSATVQPNSTNGKSNPGEKSAAPVNTFLVPTKLNITFTPRIKEIKFGKESIYDFKGDVVIRNGQMALNNIDMRTPEARLNFTALYRSPRKNNLFLALSMHLVDIKIHALINTLPDIDTILPMLKSFAGEADFHFAVQTNLDSNYNIKFSTLTGAVSIQGEDLVVMDGETFSTLAKYLMFKKKTKNKIDSLYAVFTIYKNEIDVYPILVSMDKYQVVVGGRHNIDMSFDYHADLIKSPIGFTVGVDVYGNLDKLKYRIFSKPRYPADFRPSSRNDLKDNQDKIKNIIRNSMLIGFE
ncbi:MAG: hypothetical protein LBC89_00610, partial [Bacteroidales bacterium]|nr:hypothetical protein [Bacteroidales bacterium]